MSQFLTFFGNIPLEIIIINIHEALMISFSGKQFPKEIILTGVRWYVAYPLSYRHVEELMAERNVKVDDSTLNRWVVEYSPKLSRGT